MSLLSHAWKILPTPQPGKIRAFIMLVPLLTLAFSSTGCDGDSVVASEISEPEAHDPDSDPEGEPDANPALVTECDTPASGWVFCDDFEEDRLNTYYAHNSSGGAYTRAASVGLEGSSGMSVRWEEGDVSVGTLQVMLGRNPVTTKVAGDPDRDYREIYWRMYVRHQEGWIGGGPDKLSRATVLAGSNWSQAMIGHVWSGQGSQDDRLVIDPASGTDEEGVLLTTRYNDFDNLRWLGMRPGESTIFEPDSAGRWYCVEAHVRLNDPGQSNGVFTLWIDDEEEVSQASLNWLGGYSAYGLNGVFFENYWNAGSPVEQERYFDNIVISTERIGCGDSRAP